MTLMLTHCAVGAVGAVGGLGTTLPRRSVAVRTQRQHTVRHLHLDMSYTPYVL